MLEKSADFVPFTPALNVTGQPAISLPLHHSADGLPIGVQLVGPPAGEELLLSLAAQLEGALPWSDRRPELAAA
jgi:amidase